MARGSGGHSGGNSSGGSNFSPEFHVELASGSIVFAVFYAVMLLYYLRGGSYVFAMVAFFCASELLNTAFTGDP